MYRRTTFLRSLTLVAALAGAATLWALLPGAAAADELVESEPPAGEVLGEAPHVILLTFDEELQLEPGLNSAAIIDADGNRVDDGRAEISGYSARSLLVRLRDGVEPEGDLTVVWVVQFAGRGEPSEGSLAFRVEPGAAPEEPAAAEPVVPRSSQSLVLWTVAILIGVAVFALLLYYLRVATGNARSSVDPPGGDSH